MVLDAILDELEYVAAQLGDLLGEEHSGTVELPTGRDQLRIMPVSFGRDETSAAAPTSRTAHSW